MMNLDHVFLHIRYPRSESTGFIPITLQQCRAVHSFVYLASRGLYKHMWKRGFM